MNHTHAQAAPNEPLPLMYFLEGLRNVLANKYMILLVGISSALAAYFLSSYLPPKYTSTVTLSVTGSADGKASWNDSATEAQLNKPFLNTQYEILTSRDLAERVANHFGLTSCSKPDATTTAAPDLNALTFDLMRNVEIVPVRNTPLFKINAHCGSPEAAKAAAELYATEFINLKREEFSNDKDSTTEWMNSRMDKLRNQLTVAENALQNYKEKEALYSSSIGGAIEEAEVEKLLTAYSEEQRKVANLEAIHEQMSTLGDEFQIDELMTITAIREDRIVSALISQLAELKAAYESALEMKTAAHPSLDIDRIQYQQLVIQLRDQVRMVSKGLDKQLVASRASLNNLKREIDAAKSVSIVLDGKRNDLNRLEQNVEINRELYRNFIERVNDLVHAQGFIGENLKVVGKAYLAGQPSSPNAKLIAIAAFVATTMLLALFFVLRGFRDSGLKGPADVEYKLNSILLGYLPKVKSNQSHLAYQGYVSNSRSPFSEAIRSIRTSLSLLNINKKDCIVTVVTSSIPNEGKSTVALNLAASFSQLGKVLIIDADVRKPTLLGSVGLPDSSGGLMNALANDRPFNECVYQAPDSKYDIMPAGKLSAKYHNNPSSPKDSFELLALNDYQRLIENLRQHYDHIIIDSPPICGFSDAKILAASATQVIYVVAAFQTQTALVKRGIKELQSAGVNLAGIILNKVNIEKMRHYGYDSYYEYYQQAQ